jgi:transcriptional regulator
VYVPEAFREARPEILHDLIRRHSFGTLVSNTPSGLFATHLPFLLDPDRGPHGTLVGHMARANDHWRSLEADADVRVLFQGPLAYVSPAWYTTPMAVPTWNYVAVHAYGRPILVQEGPRLLEILDRTVRTHEAQFAYQWRPPEGDFVPRLARQVVGFEIALTRLEGKLKLGQNRSRADQQGTIDGLSQQNDPLAREVADLMAARLDPAP